MFIFQNAYIYINPIRMISIRPARDYTCECHCICISWTAGLQLDSWIGSMVEWAEAWDFPIPYSLLPYRRTTRNTLRYFRATGGAKNSATIASQVVSKTNTFLVRLRAAQSTTLCNVRLARGRAEVVPCVFKIRLLFTWGRRWCGWHSTTTCRKSRNAADATNPKRFVHCQPHSRELSCWFNPKDSLVSN